MNLAGFCRNCLSKWYRAAAEERGLDLTYEQAREIVYGMPYAKWKAKHQSEATPEQQATFAREPPRARLSAAKAWVREVIGRCEPDRREARDLSGSEARIHAGRDRIGPVGEDEAKRQPRSRSCQLSEATQADP